MNEHGIYSLEVGTKKKGDKVSQQFANEEDIFNFLDIEYKTPIERIDGRAIVFKSIKQKQKLIEYLLKENEFYN